MVTLQILVLPFLVRVRVPQPNLNEGVSKHPHSFFTVYDDEESDVDSGCRGLSLRRLGEGFGRELAAVQDCDSERRRTVGQEDGSGDER